MLFLFFHPNIFLYKKMQRFLQEKNPKLVLLNEKETHAPVFKAATPFVPLPSQPFSWPPVARSGARSFLSTPQVGVGGSPDTPCPRLCARGAAGSQPRHRWARCWPYWGIPQPQPCVQRALLTHTTRLAISKLNPSATF